MHFLSSRLLTLSQASRAGRSSVTFSGSSFSKRSSRHRQILAILVDEGFLSSVVVQKIGSVPTLTVLFTYTAKGVPVLRRRYAVSKPSRRIYLPAASLWQSRGHHGTFLISTPSGILTDAEARRRNLGGEILLCIV